MKKEIIINGIYSYINKVNYVTTVRVIRNSDASVFYSSLLDDGKFSTGEFRMSKKSFEKYTYQHNA